MEQLSPLLVGNFSLVSLNSHWLLISTVKRTQSAESVVSGIGKSCCTCAAKG